MLTLTPIDDFLDRQAELTAVERFSAAHDSAAMPAGTSLWRDRLPATPPGPGQQYAFDVDLDACTGCKSCVAACHNLNGLDEGESWRRTGTLHGRTDQGPSIQTVTGACHHCVDPACLNGCPAEAYEKDPITGIVRHLDDNCIGCQYCTLTCPYDVPQFQPSLGIVRKCDMCADRLSAGEAPACVQGCPTGAITIGIVSVAEAFARSVGEARLVPGAPPSAITIPTTTYRSKRLGDDLGLASAPLDPVHHDPADLDDPDGDAGFSDVARATRPGHGHAPLTVMLVLTQVAVGTLIADAVLTRTGVVGDNDLVGFLGLLVGIVALSASLLHLGRPLLAWRAVLGLRHSWLSREIVVFTAFAGAAMANTALIVSGLFESLQPWVFGAAIACGVGGIACSVELYVVTGRSWWTRWRTAVRFGATASIGGILLAGTAHALDGSTSERLHLLQVLVPTVSVVAIIGVGVAVIGLPRRGRQGTRGGELSATRYLLGGELRSFWVARVATAFMAVAVAAVTLATAAGGSSAMASAAGLLLAAVVAVTGELFERHLFFTASAPPRMPGEPS